MKNYPLHFCYKCSTGRHSQHSEWIGKGITRGLWPEAMRAQMRNGEICTCPRCFDSDWYRSLLQSELYFGQFHL